MEPNATTEQNNSKKSKKKILIIAAILAMALIGGIAIFLFINSNSITALSIRIQRMVGEVNLYDAEGKNLSLIERMRLNSGQSLTTGDESLVMMSLDETKLMTLEQTSKAKIVGRKKELEFQLTEGSMFFNITEKIAEDEKFDIRTTTMLCGIRGTSAYIGKDEAGRDTLMVTDGIVAVTGENPRTHETIKDLVFAGQQVTVYLDDEAEGDATISFRFNYFKEEDLPALALDAIRKDAELQNRISKATGFSTKKMNALAQVSSRQGKSMYGSAAVALSIAGIEDAIPLMGQPKHEMVRAANNAFNTAGKDLDLEVAILKGLRDVLNVGTDNDRGNAELTGLMQHASDCVDTAVTAAQDAGVTGQELITVAEAVTDSLINAVEDMAATDLSTDEITEVVDAIAEVYKDTIGSVASDGNVDQNELVAAVADASDYAKETVSAEMEKRSDGDKTVVALLSDEEGNPAKPGKKPAKEKDEKKKDSEQQVAGADRLAASAGAGAGNQNNRNGNTGAAGNNAPGNASGPVAQNLSNVAPVNAATGSVASNGAGNTGDTDTGRTEGSSENVSEENSGDQNDNGSEEKQEEKKEEEKKKKKEKKYSVSLDPRGGSINSGNITSYVEGKGALLPTNVTKSGTDQYEYEFEGWYTSASGGTQVSAIGKDESGDKSYYAHWKQVTRKYMINWVNENGSLLASKEYSYGAYPSYPGVTPTKAPDSEYSYTFNGWTPAVTSVRGDATYTATFRQSAQKFTITVTAGTGGTASASVSKAAPGETVTVTATPDAQHDFAGWTDVQGNTGINTTAASASFTMPAGAVSLSAAFIEKNATKYTITLVSASHGTVSISGADTTSGGGYEAAKGKSITISTTPDNGYQLKGIHVTAASGMVNAPVSGNNASFTMPEEAVTVEAEFETATYTVTLNTAGGTINTGNVTGYTYGSGAILPTDVTKTATAQASYTFAGWFTEATGGSQVTAITASDYGDKIFYAHWTETVIDYDITVSAGTGGSVAVSANGSAVTRTTAGTSITVTVTPDTGYVLDTISVSGTSGAVTLSGTGNTRTFTMPAEDVTVSATFTQLTYTITGSSTAYGSVTSDISSAHYGETITLTVAAGTGYELQTLIVTDTNGTVSLSGTGNTRTFSMPASNVTVNATFRARTWTVSLNTVGGTINSGNVTNYTYGVGATLPSDVTKQSTATAAYAFAGWYTEETGGSRVESIGADETGTKQFWAHWIETAPGYGITIASVSDGSITASVNGAVVSEAPVGATVTLIGLPSVGYELGSVTVTKASGGTVTVTGTGNTRTFTMPAEAVTVNGGFTVISYAVDLSAITNGNVVRDRTTAHQGDTVTLTVSADPGYELDTLTVTKAGGGTVHVSGNGSVRTFRMPAENVTVAATFRTADYIVVLVTDGGIINSGNVTSYTYGVGATLPMDVTKAASAGKSYAFDGWFTSATGGNRVGAIGTTESGNKVFYAHYTETALPFAITIVPTTNGTVTATVSSSPVTSALKGTSITLTVTPESAYLLDAASFTVKDETNRPVTVSRITPSDDTQWAFTMPGSAVTVEAVFLEQSVDYYTVTPCSEMNNVPVTLTPDKARYITGETVTLMVTPMKETFTVDQVGYITASDYQADPDWPADWTMISGSGSNYSFTMPAEDVLVRASFAFDNRYNISLDYYAAGGTVTASAAGTPVTKVASGTEITLFVKTNAGYEFDPSSIAAMNYNPNADPFDSPYSPILLSAPTGSDEDGYTYTFTMSSYDVIVYVPFATSSHVPYSITIDPAIVHGTVYSLATSAEEGESVLLGAIPASGYTLDHVTVTDESGADIPVSDLAGSLSFNMPAHDVTVTASFVPLYRISTQYDAAKIAGIEINDSEGAVVSDGVLAGTEVLVSVAFTNPNFDLDELLVTDTTGNPVTARYQEERTQQGGPSMIPGMSTPSSHIYVYSFTMPASHVNVRATARALQLASITSINVQYYDGTNWVDGTTGGTATLNRTTVAPGETVTLTAAPAAGYYCNGWMLYAGNNYVDNGMMNPDNTVEITIPANGEYDFSLMVGFSVTSQQTAYSVSVETSVDAFITPDKALATEGETVTLTVTSPAGYYCSKIVLLDEYDYPWGTVYSGCMVGGTVGFTMPSDNVIVNASFVQMLTITPDYYTGGGTVTVDEYANSGDVIPLRVIPGSGFTLDTVEISYVRRIQTGTSSGGKNDGEPIYSYVSTTEEITLTNGVGSFTMPESNVVLHVVFSPTDSTSYSVTVDPSITYGEVTPSVSSGREGDWVTLDVSSDNGYRLETIEAVDASENEVDLVEAGNNEYGFYIPASNVMIYAEFAREYTLSYERRGIDENDYGPSVYGVSRAVEGENVTINYQNAYTFTAGYEYAKLNEVRISYLDDNGDVRTETISSDNSGIYTITMPASNVTVEGWFVYYYPLEVICETNGGGAVADPQMVRRNETGTYIITPDTGYRLSRLRYYRIEATEFYTNYSSSRVSDKAIPQRNVDGTYSLSWVVRHAKDNRIYLSFEKESYDITVAPTTGGTVTKAVDGETASTAQYGDTVNLTVTPEDANHTLKRLSVRTASGTAVLVYFGNGGYSFTMPASAVTVSAEFIETSGVGAAEGTNSSDWFTDKEMVRISSNMDLASLTIPANKTLEIASGVSVTVSSSVTIGNGAVVNNYGTFTNSGTMTNDGTFNNYSGNTLNNYGTIINNGTLVNGDGGDHDGRLNNHDGAVIENNGTIINNEGSVVNNDGEIEGNAISGEGVVNGEDSTAESDEEDADQDASEEEAEDPETDPEAESQEEQADDRTAFALKLSETITGGTIDLSAEDISDISNVPEGTKITLTPMPEEGYTCAIGSVTATDANGERILLTYEVESGTYTFDMPASDVTVSAVFNGPENEGNDTENNDGGADSPSDDSESSEGGSDGEPASPAAAGGQGSALTGASSGQSSGSGSSDVQQPDASANGGSDEEDEDSGAPASDPVAPPASTGEESGSSGPGEGTGGEPSAEGSE